MSIGDSMKKLIGIEDYEENLDITEEEIEAEKDKMSKVNKQQDKPLTPDRQRKPAAAPAPERRFSITNSGAFKLILIEPKTFDECTKLVDSLKGRRPVIINLEKLDTETARKIFDFMSGATYALNGNIQKVANNIFIFAPENVDIAGGQLSENGNFDFGADDKKDDNPWR